MPIAYIQSNQAVGKIVTLSNVKAGSLIVSLCYSWDDSGAHTATLLDGNNAPDGYSTIVSNSTQVQIRFAYWLWSPKSGSVTYTWTNSGTSGTVHVFELSHRSLIELDTTGGGATGTSLVATSASISSSDTSMVGFGGAGWYNSEVSSSAQLDGVNVDQLSSQNDSVSLAYGAMSMRLMNNPAGYTSAITVSNTSAQWAADVIGFKEVNKMQLNNYQFVKAGDGMSTSEKIR